MSLIYGPHNYVPTYLEVSRSATLRLRIRAYAQIIANCHFVLGKGTGYCDQRVCLSVHSRRRIELLPYRACPNCSNFLKKRYQNLGARRTRWRGGTAGIGRMRNDELRECTDREWIGIARRMDRELRGAVRSDGGPGVGGIPEPGY